MPEQNSSSNPGMPDDAMNDMISQITARVVAAMREEAGASGGNGQSASGQGGSDQSSSAQTGQKTDDVADQTRQKASGLVGTVKQQAASRLDKQKEHAVDELTSVAGSVRQMGEQLKSPEHGAVAQYAAQYGDMAADQLQQVAGYLRQHDVKQLVREVEGFARREPVLFTGGAFLLGLIGARFLKSKPVHEEVEDVRPASVSWDAFSPIEDDNSQDTGLDVASLDVDALNDEMDIASVPLFDDDSFSDEDALSAAQETTPDQVAPPITIKP